MLNKKIIATLLVLCWAFSGCVSYIDTRKMNVVTDNKSTQILNLKYAGDAEEKFAAMADNMARNSFTSAQGQEYGYYDIRYEITTRDYRPLTTYMAYVPLLWPVFLFGVPTAGQHFTLVAHLYIFDSNGNLVKHYSNTEAYKQSVNLYRSGSRVTKRGATEFAKLFNVIFDEAASQSREINEALRETGPIANNTNMVLVQANIDRYFKENPYAQNRR